MPFPASTHAWLHEKWAEKWSPGQRNSITISPRLAPPISRWSRLAGFSDPNVIVTDKELRRALVGATDDRQEPRYLAARDQSQCAAFGAGKHGPVRVVVIAYVAGVFEHEHRPRLHLFRDPLRQYIQFLDHDTSW